MMTLASYPDEAPRKDEEQRYAMTVISDKETLEDIKRLCEEYSLDLSEFGEPDIKLSDIKAID